MAPLIDCAESPVAGPKWSDWFDIVTYMGHQKAKVTVSQRNLLAK
jgi:hypothetical protein